MADSTIPGLVAVTVPAGTDLIGVRQSGDTRDKKLTVTQLLSLGAVPDPILLSAGLVSAPSYSFSADPDTGVFNTGADILGLAAGGVELLRAIEAVGAQQIRIALTVQNAAATPSLAFGDGDTGFYESVDDVLSFANAGVVRMTFGSTGLLMSNSSAGAVLSASATATVPTLTPSRGDANTGIGSNSGDELSLIAGSVEGLRLTELNSGVIQVPNANVAVTAFATGGQGSATQLDESYNVIGTVATTGDSVKLPPVFAINSVVYIKNDGANAADVFPATGDDLGAGVNTAVSLAAGSSLSFIATVANSTWTQWIVDTAGGKVVQTSITEDGEVSTGTTTIPVDNSIPQITEGDEYMTLVHTPLDAANLLNITVGVYLEGLSRMSVALFQDATADAIAAINDRGDDGDPKFMYFRTQIVAGGTSAITFRVRAGSTGGTTTFNGISSGRIFGGVMSSNIYIEEVTP